MSIYGLSAEDIAELKAGFDALDYHEPCVVAHGHCGVCGVQNCIIMPSPESLDKPIRGGCPLCGHHLTYNIGPLPWEPTN